MQPKYRFLANLHYLGMAIAVFEWLNIITRFKCVHYQIQIRKSSAWDTSNAHHIIWCLFPDLYFNKIDKCVGNVEVTKSNFILFDKTTDHDRLVQLISYIEIPSHNFNQLFCLVGRGSIMGTVQKTSVIVYSGLQVRFVAIWHGLLSLYIIFLFLVTVKPVEKDNKLCRRLYDMLIFYMPNVIFKKGTPLVSLFNRYLISNSLMETLSVNCDCIWRIVKIKRKLMFWLVLYE